MAAKDGRTLEQTPTWAVAGVWFVLVAVSIIIEHTIHLLGKFLAKRNKKALYDALEKVKSELMLLGFLSFLLTVGQGPISEFCVSKSIGNSWHPCSGKQENYEHKGDGENDFDDNDHRRRLLLEYMDSGGTQRRVLSAGGPEKCADEGKVPFVSSEGIHQLHIFIFVLAVFHVLCCLITLALGRAKMRRWKAWELETRTPEYQYCHDPKRFQFARDTSFGRRHMSCWSQSPVLRWVVCFFRQFVRSVPKVDYLTLRHGFLIAHLSPHSQTNFDFREYIKRSIDEDFKVVVGISPPIWFFAVLFLLANTHEWRSYLWLPFVPLIIVLLVGTKLQVIITKMGLRIQERGEVVKGAPVVQPGDDLFWFNRPRLVLYLIQFVFFQNAFQLAFFAWAWLEFGKKSCFHERTEDVVIRISMGVLVQILCSYVTLPRYALVTQMGSNMKPIIFNERVTKALHTWHQTARTQIKKNRQPALWTPTSSIASTPFHGSSQANLLPSYRTEVDSAKASQRNSNYRTEPLPEEQEDDSQSGHRTPVQVKEEDETQEHSNNTSSKSRQFHHEIKIADY